MKSGEVDSADDGGTASRRRRSKIQTRAEILDASFRLLEGQGLDGLSIREVTGAVGVTPAAFYRHFEDIDELSLSLVDESLSALRNALRGSLGTLDPDNAPSVIATTVETLRSVVREQAPMMRFIARERFSGRAVARRAIQDGMHMIVLELASQLRHSTRLAGWSWEDLLVVSEIFLQVGIRYLEQLMSVAAESAREEEFSRQLYKQLFLIAFGVDAFGSEFGDTPELPAFETDATARLPRTEADATTTLTRDDRPS